MSDGNLEQQVIPKRPRWLKWSVIAAAYAVLILGSISQWTQIPWFWPLVFLPGIAGVANYIVTSRQRDADDPGGMAADESMHRPRPEEAVVASLLITAVFSIVAVNASSKEPTIEGLVYAGYGAYISTLWFMLVRLNANALSPRFLFNSALKASTAILIGYIAAASGILKTETGPKVLYFLIGLFQPSVMKALKNTAMKTFGVSQAGAADLPVNLLEGVDDGAVDVLEEIGITSIQHLATMHPPEVCGRSLYPRDRVLDWIDQAILVIHTNNRINDLRAIGIRTAHSLIKIAEQCDACTDRAVKAEAQARFKEAAQRIGVSTGGLRLLTKCILIDPTYEQLAKARQGPEIRLSGYEDQRDVRGPREVPSIA